MKKWTIKKGHDFRIRTRHPWVFSNELMSSPKDIVPGETVELQDIQGRFLARGYGNPHSLIAFRAMSFSQKEEFSMEPDFLSGRILSAWAFRHRSGFRESFRICYSEADQMPGLILDRYVFEKGGKRFQVFSYQLLTSGMDSAFKKNENWKVLFQNLAEKSCQAGYSDIGWEQTLLLQRNDVNIRKLEGLEIEAPVVLRGEDSLQEIEIHLRNVLRQEENLKFSVNLPEGQKTGFFLDQSFNMRLLIGHLEMQKELLKKRKIRILDLCCYMGQWSAQIAANLKAWGVEAEIHLVDVSELALTKAKQNVSSFGYEVLTYKLDVLSLAEDAGLSALKFDIVISDPPAFVKNKKDIHQGLHAYEKLNAQAFRMCASGAVVVSCTCSGLVGLEDFKESLRKAVLKSGANARCLAYGGQGWDHPSLMSFPEGYYLKMVLHQLD